MEDVRGGEEVGDQKWETYGVLRSHLDVVRTVSVLEEGGGGGGMVLTGSEDATLKLWSIKGLR